MAVDQEDYVRTIEALTAFNLSNLNAISALLVRLARKGVLDTDDVNSIESATRSPLDAKEFADRETIAEIYAQHDELFSGLRKILTD